MRLYLKLLRRGIVANHIMGAGSLFFYRHLRRNSCFRFRASMPARRHHPPDLNLRRRNDCRNCIIIRFPMHLKKQRYYFNSERRRILFQRLCMPIRHLSPNKRMYARLKRAASGGIAEDRRGKATTLVG